MLGRDEYDPEMLSELINQPGAFTGFARAFAAMADEIRAKQQGITNFSILVSHVLVPPSMASILQSPLNRVQGFLGPGHVHRR